jgi:hypothetical protein
MDILKLNNEQIRNLDIETYYHMLNYAWITYTERRIGYNLAKVLGGKKSNNNTKGGSVDFTDPESLYKDDEYEKRVKIYNLKNNEVK